LGSNPKQFTLFLYKKFNQLFILCCEAGYIFLCIFVGVTHKRCVVDDFCLYIYSSILILLLI